MIKVIGVEKPKGQTRVESAMPELRSFHRTGLHIDRICLIENRRVRPKAPVKAGKE